MTKLFHRIWPRHRLPQFLLICGFALLFSGCQTISFYGQAIHGQYKMLADQKPLDELIASPDTSTKLRDKLSLILELRRYAEQELKLKADGNYLKYADLHRSNAVWNVYAAPELSMESKPWWYPVVGRLTYRGYFSERGAEKYAAKLRKQGYDVYVGGVDAYSTLGWFKDPVLNTFIDNSDRWLANLIFHELSHRRVFAKSDTEFNEAFATAVAEVGAKRWLESRHDTKGLEKLQRELDRKKDFLHLVQTTREQLRAVYAEAGDVAAKRQKKQFVVNHMRQKYTELKEKWGGYKGYDEWFAGPLNNAQLNTVATYYDLVPAFHRMLEQQGGDLIQFYAQADKMTKLSKNERHAALDKLLGQPIQIGTTTPKSDVTLVGNQPIASQR